MTPANPRYKWYVVGLLACIAMVNYADRTAISAVFPLVRHDLHMSDVALAAIGSFFLWSYAVGSPFAGALADRLPRSRMVVWSLVAWSAITALSGLSRSANELLISRVLLGLAECAYLPAAMALLSDHHAGPTRATAMGMHMAGLNFGLVAGGTLAGYLGDHFGWRPSFFVLGVAGLLLALVASATLRDAPVAPRAAAAPRTSLRESVRTLARIPTYNLALISGMLVSIGTWIFFNWLPLYFKETFHMSLTGAGFSGTFMLQMAATIGVTAGGYLSDRASRGRPERRMLVGTLCYLLGGPFLITFATRAGFGLVSASIFSFAFLRAVGSITEPTVACDLLPSHLRSTALALMNSANCMAGGVGVMLAGFLKSSFGLAGVFAGVSVSLLTASGVLLAGYTLFARRDLARRDTAA
jgi:predicted MFS family arabinose efflux permease